MIPEHWEEHKLGEVAKVTSGGTPNRNQPAYWGGHIPWITTSSINFNVIYEANEYITEEGLISSSAKVFPPGTILMAMYGQGVTRGRVAILGIEASTNQACAAILVNHSKADYRYLYYYLTSQYQVLRDLSHGGSQRNLSGELIKNVAVVLPPLAEQRRIAEILGTWDEAIALTVRLIDALRDRKKGLMQLLLSGEVRFSGFEGDSWEEVALHEVVTPIARREAVDPDREYRLVGVRWYVAGAHIHEVLPGSQIATELLSRIHENDILYNKMWVSKSAFAVARQEHHGAYGTTEYPQFEAIPERLNVNFLGYIFHDFKFQYDATALCKGTTGRARLNPGDFIKIKIWLPPLPEQTRIADVLQTCDDELTLFTKYLDDLKLQKRGLMQQLLTGQIRVGV